MTALLLRASDELAEFEITSIRDRVRIFDILDLLYRKDARVYIILTKPPLDTEILHARLHEEGEDARNLDLPLYCDELHEEGK